MLSARAAAERSGRTLRRARFDVGDHVRIERHRHAFRKGYLPRFTDEVFTVVHVCRTRRPFTYTLEDAQGETIKGLFYAQDLCLVLPPLPPSVGSSEADDRVYSIEKVLKRRRRLADGAEECLVKWTGYSQKHNSWIPATSII